MTIWINMIFNWYPQIKQSRVLLIQGWHQYQSWIVCWCGECHPWLGNSIPSKLGIRPLAMWQWKRSMDDVKILRYFPVCIWRYTNSTSMAGHSSIPIWVYTELNTKNLLFQYPSATWRSNMDRFPLETTVRMPAERNDTRPGKQRVCELENGKKK